jgi:hypothetical protein
MSVLHNRIFKITGRTSYFILKLVTPYCPTVKPFTPRFQAGLNAPPPIIRLFATPPPRFFPSIRHSLSMLWVAQVRFHSPRANSIPLPLHGPSVDATLDLTGNRLDDTGAFFIQFHSSLGQQLSLHSLARPQTLRYPSTRSRRLFQFPALFPILSNRHNQFLALRTQFAIFPLDPRSHPQAWRRPLFTLSRAQENHGCDWKPGKRSQ